MFMIKKIYGIFFLTILLSTQTFADECSQVPDANSIYRSISESTASNLSIRRLQQIVGVTADGIWGRQSDAAYSNLISRCNSYTYPGVSLIVNEAKITDFYKNQTVFEQIPFQSCSNEKIPVYGEIKAKPEVGAVVGGAVLGGIIGKTVTKKDRGAAVGAIIGGAIANESQKSKTKTEVIGYENLQRCETKFKNSPKEETVYSYSTITFILDGKEQTIEFQKLQ
jgi:uncharacterized protein YcfJ|tara:strand:+ start:100 stop:771 length:672 start_codon:yes stop_codon:yes gene_type:complete